MFFRLQSNGKTVSDLPPSLQVQGLTCTRRLWLKYHHLELSDGQLWKQSITELKSLLTDEWKHDWRFELRLPSGTKIDAWIPDEHVFIEFKTGEPNVSHLYQTWMKAEELELYAVKEWEYQLWYEEKWMKEAKVMADNLNLDSGLNIAGIFALAIEEPDKDFTFRRERDTAIFLADLEKTEPPPVKKRDKYPCRTCDYFEFCHL